MNVNTKEAYEKRLRAQLAEWDAEIDKFRARAEQAQADAQLDLQRHLDRLQEQRDVARQRLAELQRAGDDAWRDLKTGIDRAWDTLSDSIRAASSRFR